MRKLAPHTFILAAILALGACSPASEAPTPKSEAAAETSKPSQTSKATSNKAEAITSAANDSALSENARLDAWFETNYKTTIRA